MLRHKRFTDLASKLKDVSYTLNAFTHHKSIVSDLVYSWRSIQRKTTFTIKIRILLYFLQTRNQLDKEVGVEVDLSNYNMHLKAISYIKLRFKLKNFSGKKINCFYWIISIQFLRNIKTRRLLQ